MYGECYQAFTRLALIGLRDTYGHVPISPKSILPSCSNWVTNNTAFRPRSWHEHGPKDHHETGISDHFWPEAQWFLGPAYLNNWLVRMESEQLSKDHAHLVIAEIQSRGLALDSEKSRPTPQQQSCWVDLD